MYHILCSEPLDTHGISSLGSLCSSVSIEEANGAVLQRIALKPMLMPVAGLGCYHAKTVTVPEHGLHLQPNLGLYQDEIHAEYPIPTSSN